MPNMVDMTPTKNALTPSRCHHNSWVTNDQERTRAFYEEVLGIPLKAFWIETNMLDGETVVLSHAFYGLPDGSALTFFHMADQKFQEKFKSPKTEIFNHFAFKVDAEGLEAIKNSLMKAGFDHFIMEHGYCRSLYTIDPNGLRLEFAVDSPQVDLVEAEQTATAHDTMKEWIAGRRTTNNHWRTSAATH